MGLFRKLASVLTGTPETTLIKTKAEFQYALDKVANPKMIETLESIVDSYFEQSVPKVVHLLGNSLKHHSKVSQSDADHIKSHSFLDKFVMHYVYNIFRKGFSFGHQLGIGAADEQFQKEVGLLLDEVVKEMVKEVKTYFKSDIVAESFIIALKTSFDLGVESGIDFSKQEYVVIPK